MGAPEVANRGSRRPADRRGSVSRQTRRSGCAQLMQCSKATKKKPADNVRNGRRNGARLDADRKGRLDAETGESSVGGGGREGREGEGGAQAGAKGRETESWDGRQNGVGGHGGTVGTRLQLPTSQGACLAALTVWMPVFSGASSAPTLPALSRPPVAGSAGWPHRTCPGPVTSDVSVLGTTTSSVFPDSRQFGCLLASIGSGLQITQNRNRENHSPGCLPAHIAWRHMHRLSRPLHRAKPVELPYIAPGPPEPRRAGQGTGTWCDAVALSTARLPCLSGRHTPKISNTM